MAETIFSLSVVNWANLLNLSMISKETKPSFPASFESLGEGRVVSCFRAGSFGNFGNKVF